MVDYIIFGIIDNAVMLAGALLGVSIENHLPAKLQNGFYGVTIGAGLGNAFSDFLGGLGALNLPLAIGTASGCIIALVLIPIYNSIRNKKII